MTRAAENTAFDFPRRIAAEADPQGIRTALIGAMALAAHGHVRATQDIDLGVCTSFFPGLRGLHDRLRELG